MGRNRNKEMPNLFIIGAAKCGTTSLHHYLDLHPEISMSKVKEPTYFARHDPEIASWAIVDRSEYLHLFEGGTAYRGETSTAYSRAPLVEGVPEAIAAETPEAKLIYMVGDPIRRIEADIRQMLSNRLGQWAFVPEDGSVTEIFGEPSDPSNRLFAQSRFMYQLERYLGCFDPGSILIVDSDGLRNERRETMTRIFEFLGVDSGFWSEEMMIEFNKGREKKRTSDAYVRLARLKPAKAVLSVIPRSVRIRFFGRVREAVGRPWSPPALDQKTREQFEELLRPEVEALRDFTGQPFEGWSI